jgi:transposase-like zinc-binding protein/putative transposase
VGRFALELADIFRIYGPAWRQAQRAHLSLAQLKVMSAIEQCRSAALGGHVLRCEDCGSDQIAYNSCRNRHCPKCQSAAARRWLEARKTDLLPVEYYHVVFTLPAPISAIAYYNKAVVYELLFELAAETLLTIGSDPKHLGARIGTTLVLHTWGSALTHHPHVHGIVAGGGLSPYRERWLACKRGFFLPVRVLSRLFRRRFLEELAAAHHTGQLKTMTLAVDEFMRRFLLHVLPSGFHRIRHYGLIANAGRTENLARVRELLHVVPEPAEPQPPDALVGIVQPTFVCPHCGAAMIIVETFARGQPIRAPPPQRAAA